MLWFSNSLWRYTNFESLANQKPRGKLTARESKVNRPAKSPAHDSLSPENQDTKDKSNASKSPDVIPRPALDSNNPSHQQNIASERNFNSRANQPSSNQIQSSPLIGQPILDTKFESPTLRAVLGKPLSTPLELSMRDFRKLEDRGSQSGGQSQSILVKPQNMRTNSPVRQQPQRSPSPNKKVTFSANSVYFIYRK